MSLSVGQVAEIARVTVRTLHHYDEIGLRRPGGLGTDRARTGGLPQRRGPRNAARPASGRRPIGAPYQLTRGHTSPATPPGWLPSGLFSAVRTTIRGV